MPSDPLLTIDFGSVVGNFHATANDLPAIAALVVMVMGVVIGAAFVSGRRRR